MIKDSPPPVLEDHAARQVRHFSMTQEKKEKDATKKRCDRKILEHGALIKCHRQQRLKGLPKEESPYEIVLEEEDDNSDDNDVGSRYDNTTFLAHLPNVRSLQGPISGGSTS
jgi:hypothetical protein